MLNPLLFKILKGVCGDVRVSNENVKRIAREVDGKEVVSQYGESYYVDCWCCDDTKHRLSISYKFLQKRSIRGDRYLHTYHCFNEGCNIIDTPKFQRILRAVESGARDQTLLECLSPQVEQQAPKEWRLPVGFTPLVDLPENHPALEFIRYKYFGFTPKYLWDAYRVGFTNKYDPDFKLAADRVIFPVFGLDGQLAGWQGRAISRDNPVRWYLPPGFRKDAIYNAYRVPAEACPIICEGIPAAIACGPNALAIFGKELSEPRAQMIASRWSSAIIATDPETYVPDLRVRKKNGDKSGSGPIYAIKMKQVLDQHLKVPAKLISWPPGVLELARRKVVGEDVTVPDPADLGMASMSNILKAAV
jgi:hypothetical protein